MNAAIRIASAVAGLALTAQAAAEVVFYENEKFGGRHFTADERVGDFGRSGFNDRASSVVVLGERWEVCEHKQFKGHCMVLRPGRYASLAAMGLNDRISSVRAVTRNARVDDARYAPPPQVAHDYRRRNNERVYEANVTSVRAVVGAAEQRCWVESQQVAQERGGPNVPGAIVGGIVGGILGHQVGGGRGQDLATAGGAVAGAAIGSRAGGDSGGQGYGRDVRRCENVSNHAGPEYWDVTYKFRGQEHRIQMASPPGHTVLVNAQGEPRA
jgi:uncharacterized protein YcfJ